MDQDATNDSPAQPPAKRSWSLFYNCPLVKIVVGPERETFHVSRDLLIAHSPVMAAALTGDFKESREGLLVAPQFTADAYSTFLGTLHFLSCAEWTGVEVSKTNIYEWIEQVAPIADYYQTEIIREHMEEKIRTAIPDDMSTLKCVAEFEEGFPGSKPDWIPRAGHMTDADIYKVIADECSVKQAVGRGHPQLYKHVVDTEKKYIPRYLKRLRPETLVGVMIAMGKMGD